MSFPCLQDSNAELQFNKGKQVVYLSALALPQVSVCRPIALALSSPKSNEHFDSYVVATRPCGAVVAGGGDVPSSDSSHTLSSYMNKPEREKRGEQKSKGKRGHKTDKTKREILGIFVRHVKRECHLSGV